MLYTVLLSFLSPVHLFFSMPVISYLPSKCVGGDRGNIAHRERDDRDRDRRNSGGSGLGTPFIILLLLLF